ncbi:MAG: S8 family serine peptidase, partial [Burkholderiaceae bacterium]|nr:S8 family serine peptidase [Burkholderiaceae bacterium]
SMSIAGSSIEPAITQLITDAISQGITVVVAAGNQACAPTYSNGAQTWIRNCTQTTMPRSFPGSLAIPGLITVGAIGRDLTRNSYSNYGSFVDVV